MNKKLIAFAILAVLVSLVINIFAGGRISAKLSSMPFFEKYKILNPQAPIVITKRDDVKSGDSGEMLDAINKAKSRLSSVVTISGTSIAVNGSAINLSSDGYFLTTQQAIVGMSIPDKPKTIILNNGEHAVITQAYGEAGSNLVIVKADLANVPTTEFGSSKAMTPGQKIGFIHNSGATSGAVFFQESYITSAQHDTAGQVLHSDKPLRTFGAQSVGSLTAGEAIINSDGKVIGVWDGSFVVSSDAVNDTVRNFFNNGSKGFLRPQWRFTYRNIGSLESELYQLPLGALVVGVEPLGPGASSGLKPGDSITAIAGQNVTVDNTLEELLQTQKPGEPVGVTVVREKKLMTITITPGI